MFDSLLQDSFTITGIRMTISIFVYLQVNSLVLLVATHLPASSSPKSSTLLVESRPGSQSQHHSAIARAIRFLAVARVVFWSNSAACCAIRGASAGGFCLGWGAFTGGNDALDGKVVPGFWPALRNSRASNRCSISRSCRCSSSVSDRVFVEWK